ncbi:MAG TPA: glycine reductase [Clostridia bacterium]|nr:glycine reductase [Clostridia bacterium]
MNYPVIKGASYALIHAPNMLLQQGTTQTTERLKHPDSEYLQKLPGKLRSFEEAVRYPANQTYIGNILPDELAAIPRPWYENPTNGGRQGKYGEIMPEEEFLGLIKIVDAFDLVLLEESFQAEVKSKIAAHPVLGDLKDLGKLDRNPATGEDIKKLVEAGLAEPLYLSDDLVGCVKRAHEFDPALSAHVMLENLVSKASAAFGLKLLLAKTSLAAEEVEYIIECSEEACGDMNQRGGGNFAKAIGEICGLVNATGSDTRGFCAAPAHAVVSAAGLVQSGIYQNVVIVAGGSTAKLGMNARDHVAKGLPVLEDMLATFAIHIGENDGVSPVIRTDVIGRHKIGSGASPQAVMQAIVTDPLDKAGIKLSEIDRFSPEMQNPEITEPAGAGNVPNANYKMIAALGVKRGDFAREDLAKVVEKVGMPGYAPTQGHIPSGVPFIGFARDLILEGKIKNTMIIGKGSLFLGRLTNLFDGISFIIEKNSGIVETGLDKDEIRKIVAEALRDFAGSLKLKQ